MLSRSLWTTSNTSTVNTEGIYLCFVLFLIPDDSSFLLGCISRVVSWFLAEGFEVFEGLSEGMFKLIFQLTLFFPI